MADLIEHLKEFELARANDEAPSSLAEHVSDHPFLDYVKERLAGENRLSAEEYARLHPDDLKFSSSGFKTTKELEALKSLAYPCPFCRELPYLSKAYKHRVGDNKVVYCGTIGCAIYKFAIVIRIWNKREPYFIPVVNKLNDPYEERIEIMEDISGRRKDD